MACNSLNGKDSLKRFEEVCHNRFFYFASLTAFTHDTIMDIHNCREIWISIISHTNSTCIFQLWIIIKLWIPPIELWIFIIEYIISISIIDLSNRNLDNIMLYSSLNCQWCNINGEYHIQRVVVIMAWPFNDIKGIKTIRSLEGNKSGILVALHRTTLVPEVG